MGNSLRHLISTEMFNHYVNVFRSLELKYNEQQNSTNKGEAADDKPKINIKQIYQIVSSLKKQVVRITSCEKQGNLLR